MNRVGYLLKLGDDFLYYKEDGEVMIFGVTYDDDEAVKFPTEEQAIAAICDSFSFHHGCGCISEHDSAKERLQKIKIVKRVTTIEEEEITPSVYVPTNIEIHEWYCAKGDNGLGIYLKSSYTKQGLKPPTHNVYEDDGYEFASDMFRIKDYNEWVAAGKPLSRRGVRI